MTRRFCATANRDGVYKSGNRGDSFVRVSSFGETSAVVVDPANSSTIYAAAAGLFKSVDGGASWNRLTSGLPDGRATALAVDAGNPRVLYTALGNGIFRTPDGGATWSAAQLGLPDFEFRVNALAVDQRVVFERDVLDGDTVIILPEVIVTASRLET